MRYEVIGARRDTGEDVRLLVEAADEAKARERAARRDVLVASCTAFIANTSAPQPQARAVTLPPADTSANGVPRLGPGETDCFFDAVMIRLLRRQVEPDELLMACDVRRPDGVRRTLLLTATRLVFVGVTDQAGRRSVVDRRDFPFEQIDSIEVAETKPTVFTKAGYVIQIGLRDGIEAWTTSFASGPRIVEAVKRLRKGESVSPLIRRIEDMAETTRVDAETPPVGGLASRLPTWTQRLIIPQLRLSTNVGVLGATHIAGSLAAAGGVVLIIFSLFGLVLGDTKDGGSSLLNIVIGVALAATGLRNSSFAKSRLTALRHGGSVPTPTHVVRPQLSVSLPSPLRRVPWTRLVTIAMPLVAAGGFGLWVYTHDKPAMDSSLPRVTIMGDVKTVEITNWRMEGWTLFATARLTGARGVKLLYRITSGGVLQEQGTISPPSAYDDVIVSREPQEVRLTLTRKPTPLTAVEITAFGE